MSTSGSINFSITKTDIINHAFRLLSIIGEQETVSAEDYAIASTSLNLMLKSWQTDDLKLWMQSEATTVLEDGIPTYQISSSSGHSSDILVETTISSDEAAAQTTLSISDTDNISANDVIGIVLDDGTIQWTTVASVTSTTVTVNNALTDDASSGNRVYAYTYSLSRPARISSVRLRNNDDIDRELKMVSRKEYYSIPNKYSTGAPLLWYYDPQLNGGVLNVWPAPDSANYRLKFTYNRSIEDLDNGSDSPDFPVEWQEAIVFALAVRLAPIFDREDKMQALAQMASELLDNLKRWDTEPASLFLRPDTDYTGWK